VTCHMHMRHDSFSSDGKPFVQLYWIPVCDIDIDIWHAVVFDTDTWQLICDVTHSYMNALIPMCDSHYVTAISNTTASCISVSMHSYIN